jgi:aromatic-amino-acid transaminase
MLENLAPQPADALLALIQAAQCRSARYQIDLGVGVYRTADGATPVFKAIKAARSQAARRSGFQAYLGPEGDMGFVNALIPYVFGADFDTAKVDGMQAPGGTGAVRLAIEVAKRAGVKRVDGHPSWPNHAQIVAAAGLELKTFKHTAPMARPISPRSRPRWRGRGERPGAAARLLPQPDRRRLHPAGGTRSPRCSRPRACCR